MHIRHVDRIGDPHSCSTTILSDARSTHTRSIVQFLSSGIDLLENQIRCPQAEITFFADIDELQWIVQMKNLRRGFLLEVTRRALLDRIERAR